MSSARPNLLVIVLDQLRYDCLGFTSGGRVSTPNIDALAAGGTSFAHAFTNIPTCCPARQSLLSGRRPESFGAYWNYDIGLPIGALTPDIPTWPAALRSAGYQSAYLGKWHVSPDHDPLDFGYETYVSQDDYAAYRAERYPGLVEPEGWGAAIDPVDLADTETHWFAQRAGDAIRDLAGGDAPWHVRLDLVQPHLPCRPVQAFAKRYRAEDVEPWPSFADTFEHKPYIQRQQLLSWGIEDWTWEEWAPIVAGYFAIISQVDDAIGRVLAALRETGQESSTLVVLTTDHGDMAGGHRMMDKHHVFYEDVMRVPLIVSWPGVVEPGASRQELVYNLLDLATTIPALLGLSALPDPAGQSLAPLLGGELPEWRDAVVATYNGQQFGLMTQRMIRTDRWKYVWNATDVDELYDLEADPSELVNLAGRAEYAALLADLRRRLYDVLLRDGDAQVDTDWVRAQLLGGRIA